MSYRRVLFTAVAATWLLAPWHSSLLRAKELPAKTAIDQYVAAPDDAYSWKVVSEKSTDGLKTVVIDMVSQTWRDSSEVDRPQWQHWITVSVPEKAKSNVGMLFIGGGSNGREPPTGPSEIVQAIARSTGSVVAELRMTPNQPLVFHNDGQRRTEDDLIGYTWDQYLKTGDPTWPARNPMIKGAVRAMDTVEALTEQEYGAAGVVDQFVVAGGSKRGWTTWLTGAVDQRVKAIIPIVIDVLNLKESVRHHFAAYGFWAPAIGDYVQHRIPQRRDHPRMPQLHELVDPFSYRHRLTMPKFIVNAAGDQFFPPDSSRYYFDHLSGVKLLRYVPNADHSLDGSDALESITAFYALVLAGQSAPEFDWTNEHDGRIEVVADDSPKEVRLWHATNPAARDFRMETLGPQYQSEVLQDLGGGRFVGEVASPDEGWTAYFVELTYEVLGGMPLKLTTDVGIIPDRLPYADKDPTLPTTVTVQCTCPDGETADRVQQAAKGAEIPGVEGEIHCAVHGDKQSDDGVRLAVNWKPAGRIEMSALAVTKWLKTMGCNGFAYRMESGPWAP